LIIIGNLVRDPELRTTSAGKEVCTFTVAVNRRKTANNQQPEADYFRVSAWEGLGKSCGAYLAKGRKVAVVGAVSVHTFQTQNGETRAQMEVLANEVEFLSPKDSGSQGGDIPSGYTPVDDADDPFGGVQ
jgi:single-strand DNA-binding protein